MNKEIEKSIELLAKKITNNTEAGDALKLTQAALNLAHTLSTVTSLKS